MKVLSFATAAVLLSVCLLAGCGGDTEPASVSDSEPVNTHCPIMGGEVTEDGGRVTWNGKLVAFCCPPCIDEWNALSDDEKAAALAKADAAGSTSAHSHDDHDHGHDEGTGNEPPASEDPAASESAS